MLHQHGIALYGGENGIRDIHALESAIAQPQATFDGQLLHPTLAGQAAAYLYHLVQGHGFVDGNKRVGVYAALVFLDQNGHELKSPPAELENIVMALASGHKTKTEIFDFMTHRIQPRSSDS